MHQMIISRILPSLLLLAVFCLPGNAGAVLVETRRGHAAPDYVYAGGNPVNRIDPTGLAPRDYYADWAASDPEGFTTVMAPLGSSLLEGLNPIAMARHAGESAGKAHVSFEHGHNILGIGYSALSLVEGVLGFSVARGYLKAIGNISRSVSQQLFHRPTIQSGKLSDGVLGTTDPYGNIVYDQSLRGKSLTETIAHEKTHSFFSPKLKIGQDVRAEVGIWGYNNVHTLKYTEEAIAETVGQFSAHGPSLGGLAKGLAFPVTHGYVSPARMAIEAGIGLGGLKLVSEFFDIGQD